MSAHAHRSPGLLSPHSADAHNATANFLSHQRALEYNRRSQGCSFTSFIPVLKLELQCASQNAFTTSVGFGMGFLFRQVGRLHHDFLSIV